MWIYTRDFCYLLHPIYAQLTGAPAGNYQIRFLVHDANSEKTATITQAITLQ
ncbi:MAG: hypothetical protein ACRERE_32005 [Candidatus Entotheonellia bacterium]